MKPSLMFSAGARIEEFLYEKLDRKAPSRITNAELLGQYMQDAGKEFDLGAPYGEYAVHEKQSNCYIMTLFTPCINNISVFG